MTQTTTLLIFLAAGYMIRSYMAARENTQNVSLAFERISEIYDSMQRIKKYGGVQQILIVKAENGGRKKYGTVIAEVGDTMSMKHSFKRMEMDREYINLLEDVVGKDYLTVMTDKLSHQSILYAQNMKLDVVANTFFSILVKENVGVYHWAHRLQNVISGKPYLFRRMYYIVCNTTDSEGKMFLPEYWATTIAEVSKIKQEFRTAVDAKVL